MRWPTRFGGQTAEKLIAKLNPGGVFASVLGRPRNAKAYPTVRVVEVYVNPDANVLLFMAQAVLAGKLHIPIRQKLPLKNAAQGHAAPAKGGSGKSLLIVENN